MGKIINVEQTVTNILSVENVQFKLLKTDEKENSALLVTPTNDNFQRGLIAIDPQKFSIGIQSPDDEGMIVLNLQPVTVEFLELISFIEVPEEVEEVVEAVKPKAAKKQVKE